MPPVQPDYFRNLVPLFTDPAWTKHVNTTTSADGKTLTLQATAAWQSSFYTVAVPNTSRIRFAADVTGGVDARITYGTLDRSGVNWVDGPYFISGSGTGLTTDYTVKNGSKIAVKVESAAAGTFTFSNLTLRRATPSSPPVQPDYFRELVVNGDFSQGATGWDTPRGVVANSSYSFVSTATWTVGASQRVTVQPLTKYRITADATGTISVNENTTPSAVWYSSGGKISAEFTTPAGISSLYLFLQSGPATGTFTFDNISLKRAMPT